MHKCAEVQHKPTLEGMRESGSHAGVAGNVIAFDGVYPIDVETRARRAVDRLQTRAHSTRQRVALIPRSKEAAFRLPMKQMLEDLIEGVQEKVAQ
jgi:hypothetical protein